MDNESRKTAAAQLEFAAGLHELAREKILQVGRQFPELFYFAAGYLGAQIEGCPEFQGFPEVIQFLRCGHDTDDRRVEQELLEWNYAATTRKMRVGANPGEGPR